MILQAYNVAAGFVDAFASVAGRKTHRALYYYVAKATSGLYCKRCMLQSRIYGVRKFYTVVSWTQWKISVSLFT